MSDPASADPSTAQVGGDPSKESAAKEAARTLDEVFTLKRMKAAWKRTVRDGMRAQHVQDLHDYLDAHRSIDHLCKRITADILRGVYRPQEPEVVTVEKKMGVVRRLLIPSAVDALVLQTLVDAIEEPIRRKQPHANAYYARSHDKPPRVEDFEGTFGYPWWKLWPKFQREIWKFSAASPFTVTTDIANYYDSIPLAKLRNSIALLAGSEDSLLDFLFFLLESFIWRPKYMPISGVGLPTIEFDTPRLLAHAYLFPIDRFLVSKVEKKYVRWMDDIDFGCESAAEAKRITGQLDEQMAALGLRLNLAKTNVMTSEEAHNYFWISENTKLNVYTNSAKERTRPENVDALLKTSVRSGFADFIQKPRTGHWDKIVKRYLTIFCLLRDEFAESEVTKMLATCPSLREPIFRYLRVLGPSVDRVRAVASFLSDACVDDVSYHDACQLFVEWEMPPTDAAITEILAIATGSVDATNPSRVGSVMRVLAKYADVQVLDKFIVDNLEHWRTSAWAARQVAALSGIVNETTRTRIKEAVIAGGLLDALQVVAHLESLLTLARPDAQLISYLDYLPASGYPYPISKFIAAFTMARSGMHDKTFVTKTLPSKLQDPIFRTRLAALAAPELGPQQSTAEQHSGDHPQVTIPSGSCSVSSPQTGLTPPAGTANH